MAFLPSVQFPGAMLTACVGLPAIPFAQTRQACLPHPVVGRAARGQVN